MTLNLLYNSASELNMAFKKASKAMYVARQKAFPKSPKNVDEIIEAFTNNEYIRTNFGLTKRGGGDDDEPEKNPKTAFFKGAIESKEYSACFFASDDIIEAIKNTSVNSERLLYADATFKITPIGIFKQVLVLFADIYTYVIEISIKFNSPTFFIFKFHFLITRWSHLPGY